ncbi:MAG: SpoIID/LytB domain-containing protein [Candidatus Omnitrophica bacterium]|nr:SpoIID/LytB domain-containing protein [Candidatus Omnitrophota bacterium]
MFLKAFRRGASASVLSRIVLALVVVCLNVTAVTAKSKLIRVSVLRDVDHFTLAVEGRHTIFDFNTGQKVTVGVRLLPAMVAFDHGKIRIGERVYDNQRLIIDPRQDATLRVNDKHFRGMLVIINTGSALTVVNSIELEQYIRGVLYHEISDKWPLEAIKAQAVATRTYALYSIDKFAARDYDVTNDVYSQVYGGKTAERYRTNLAVSRTKGEVLTYRGKIFPAFFHANSGGVTEDASELWNIDLPPLKGGVESPYSISSPHYSWRRNFRLKDIQNTLNAHGFKIGAIKNIKVTEQNKSRRVRKLEIEDRDGVKTVIDGKAFRDALGPNVLKSNMYEVEMKGYYMDLIGHGWGHGVGMCQWGAYNMSLLRFSYKQILKFYYPGSALERFSDID